MFLEFEKRMIMVGNSQGMFFSIMLKILVELFFLVWFNIEIDLWYWKYLLNLTLKLLPFHQVKSSSIVDFVKSTLISTSNKSINHDVGIQNNNNPSSFLPTKLKWMSSIKTTTITISLTSVKYKNLSSHPSAQFITIFFNSQYNQV